MAGTAIIANMMAMTLSMDGRLEGRFEVIKVLSHRV